MKRRSLVVAAAAAVMLTFSGCAFEEMLGQLDSALESVSQADSSAADSSGTEIRQHRVGSGGGKFLGG